MSQSSRVQLSNVGQNWSGASCYAISYFLSGQFEVGFFKPTPSGPTLVALESMSQIEVGTEEGKARFREQLSRHQKKSQQWIHLILRNAGFVKVLELSEDAAVNDEDLLTKTVRQQVPHLADDIIYHVAAQEKTEVLPATGLMYGVAKTVLEEQLSALQSIAITPDFVTLSTEALMWWHHHHPPQKTQDHATRLLVHLMGEQLELLYVEDGALIQSRSVKSGPATPQSIERSTISSNYSFQKDCNRAPQETIFLAADNSGIDRLPDESWKRASDWSKLDVPPLFPIVIEACRAREVFDFTPPEVERARSAKTRGTHSEKLMKSMSLLCLSFFIYGVLLVGSALGEMGWMQMKMNQLPASVQEVKAMRKEALSLRAFQERKAFPLVLLGGIQAAIPKGAVLTQLEYDEPRAIFSLQGEAKQQGMIDDFLKALSEHSTFSDVTLERVQAQRQQLAAGVYEFEMEGFLNRG
jgi:hypothetical protein